MFICTANLTIYDEHCSEVQNQHVRKDKPATNKTTVRLKLDKNVLNTTAELTLFFV